MNELSYLTFNNYMKKSPLSACEEDYLEMIYRLGINDIKSSAIAKALNVSNASISKMMKKLKEKGLLSHNLYQRISLTNQGLEVASFLYQRHLLIETFFKLIQDTDDLIEKVEKIEHTLLPTTLARIEKLISFFNNNPKIKEFFYETLT